MTGILPRQRHALLLFESSRLPRVTVAFGRGDGRAAFLVRHASLLNWTGSDAPG